MNEKESFLSIISKDLSNDTKLCLQLLECRVKGEWHGKLSLVSLQLY